MSELVLIAAVARNGVIGRDNDLPFRLPTDLKHFKALTLGHPVLMGRATFESIGRPLPGRPSIVVSGDPEFHAEGCEVYQDLDTAIDRGKMLADGLGKSALFIIGGGQIYAQTIDEADRLEITHVALDADGATRFPTIDPSRWAKTVEENVPAGPKDEADMVFTTYRRKEA
ncbi:MAG: dihydrofolate reductase [Rhizobiales bacterium]|nr:dihydrofolate reductase [Hyphomicrobiales bacterium]MBO6697673.1 dihydrofolate reductase [Hyphomicrobiales bacterium]MBO6736072.1 dihydrofolate reductase [Hyphomicrobiales bacterium]MBO6912542.1 dihydrofolate reductase [Hyphomicrobiales bacterium]MBO6956950.1 dihydrofolate reductase [Hyphomicrobiales bacterium]